MARRNKNDEFYTKLEDIESELSHYRHHFVGKTVFCNCDDPTWSNFWRYFHVNFADLGLKRLIATHYNRDGGMSYAMEYTGGDDLNVEFGVMSVLSGDGDFRSAECIALLQQADIVVTNPPFSLFREYVAQLVDYNKLFVIIGSENAITYKDFFVLLRNNIVWKGFSHVKEFLQPSGEIKKFGNICWFTNLDITKRHVPFFDPESVHAQYVGNEDAYPRYDNYAAINVNRTKDIPEDYFDVMGVPITFLDKYNPDDFEILGITCRGYSPEYRTKLYDSVSYPNANDLNGSGCILVDGQPKMLYGRILIKRKIT